MPQFLIIFYILFLNPTPRQWRLGIGCMIYSKIANTLVTLHLSMISPTQPWRLFQVSLLTVNISSHCQINSRTSAFRSITAGWFYNWCPVSLNPTREWSHSFVKVIPCLSFIKHGRCLFSKNPTSKRRLKPRPPPWWLMTRMNLKRCLIIH